MSPRRLALRSTGVVLVMAATVVAVRHGPAGGQLMARPPPRTAVASKVAVDRAERDRDVRRGRADRPRRRHAVERRRRPSRRGDDRCRPSTSPTATTVGPDDHLRRADGGDTLTPTHRRPSDDSRRPRRSPPRRPRLPARPDHPRAADDCADARGASRRPAAAPDRRTGDDGCAGRRPGTRRSGARPPVRPRRPRRRHPSPRRRRRSRRSPRRPRPLPTPSARPPLPPPDTTVSRGTA